MPTPKYPYLPKDYTVQYVSGSNKYLLAAEEEAREHSLDTTVPVGCVIVKAGKIIGQGANGSTYHQTHLCRRIELGIPTGQGYELCEGCSPKNHSEAKAIEAATQDTAGADVYLWGHWWCCRPCWDKMIAAGIAQVYLLEHSEVLFNKSNPNNILPKVAA